VTDDVEWATVTPLRGNAWLCTHVAMHCGVSNCGVSIILQSECRNTVPTLCCPVLPCAVLCCAVLCCATQRYGEKAPPGPRQASGWGVSYYNVGTNTLACMLCSSRQPSTLYKFQVMWYSL
jgi:hypothetical protein